MTTEKGKPELAEAAAQTAAVLQTLQSRLNRATLGSEVSTPEVSTFDEPDELSEQLERYFAAEKANRTRSLGVSAGMHIPSEIRNLVIDGVVDRILHSWREPNAQTLEGIKTEVIRRLVEHVLTKVLKGTVAD